MVVHSISNEGPAFIDKEVKVHYIFGTTSCQSMTQFALSNLAHLHQCIVTIVFWLTLYLPSMSVISTAKRAWGSNWNCTLHHVKKSTIVTLNFKKALLEVFSEYVTHLQSCISTSNKGVKLTKWTKKTRNEDKYIILGSASTGVWKKPRFCWLWC